tara:strand:- start:307 stop:1596 length:1290 start_codon:yes stop_codon:yes gene_type:complete
LTAVKTSEVFGIHKDIKTYVERDHVDRLFKMALHSEKQILVYGASKQGKTALVSKYCGYSEHIVYQLTPETELIDIYQHVLREAGVKVRTEFSEGTGTSSSLKLRAKIVASFAMFGKASLQSDMASTEQQNVSSKFEEIPFNINQPQDISALLKKVNNKKLVILENFHYLTYENQKRFAFDLRAFQELGVRFIILGVWRERNRMLQFNGDLLDRIQEVPVEPWEIKDFRKILDKGEELLNITFEDELYQKCCDLAFSSVGVFQDLLLGVCLSSEVYNKQKHHKLLDKTNSLDLVINEKTNSYGDRHKRALEAIASSSKNTGYEKFYYCIVDIILEGGYDRIAHGVHLNVMFDELKKRSKSNNIKIRMVKNSLASLHKVQASKNIMPPILYFDENSELLSISDSTLYFYLKNSNLTKFREQLKNSCGNKI